jgi:hypothetical protein
MALDKVKSGNFNMVNIYLEGLTPRIKGHWEKLGKQPKKREIKLVDESELRKEIQKAVEARRKFEEEQKHKEGKKEEKVIMPLRLKSGIVVMNPQELLDALYAMDENTFNQHVTAEKNELSEWLKNIDAELADKVSHVTTKEDIIRIIESKVQGK